jgi:glycosyltransferase involved in cell wall biosynthesis
MPIERLFFVSDRVDPHTDRFDRLFQSLPFDYERVLIHWAKGPAPTGSVGGNLFEDWEGLRKALGAKPSIVISGPLDSIASGLLSKDYRHIGISFATDVMVSAAESADALELLYETANSLDLVVIDNYATENALISIGVDARRILRAPWGPSEKPLKKDFKVPRGIPAPGSYVFFPRALEPLYDPEVFIKAFAALVHRRPGLVALLIESGSLTGLVKQLIKEHGLEENVAWSPPLPPDEFRELIARAAVIVVAPRTDGTSVTVMDAMHLGVPVVSSMTSGSSEWVVNGVTGWSFPVGEVEGMAVAIRSALAASPQNTGVLLNAQRLISKRAGWIRATELFTDAIESLAAGRETELGAEPEKA